MVLALQIDEAHRRSRRRFRDPLSVAVVVLLRLGIGSDTVAIARAIVRAKIEAQARAVMAIGRGVSRSVVRHPGRDEMEGDAGARTARTMG